MKYRNLIAMAAFLVLGFTALPPQTAMAEEPAKPAGESPVRLICKLQNGPWSEVFFNICNNCVTPDSATHRIKWKVSPDIFEGTTGVLRDNPTLLYRYVVVINRASGHAEVYKKFHDVENNLTTRHRTPDAQGSCEPAPANKF